MLVGIPKGEKWKDSLPKWFTFGPRNRMWFWFVVCWKSCYKFALQYRWGIYSQSLRFSCCVLFWNRFFLEEASVRSSRAGSKRLLERVFGATWWPNIERDWWDTLLIAITNKSVSREASGTYLVIIDCDARPLVPMTPPPRPEDSATLRDFVWESLRKLSFFLVTFE